MQHIFLSVIVPVYNVERYLPSCLDSIARLGGVEWEAVLVDDGSTDSSGDICDGYAARDSRFRVIHQSNAGVSAARNAGLDAARGEWIWFVDGDDTVNADSMPAACQWLCQHPSVDYVMFNFQRFNDGEEISCDTLSCISSSASAERLPVYGEKTKNDFLLKHLCAYHCLLCYRRDIIERHGIRFTLGIRNSEDGEFMAKYLMLMQHPVGIDETVYYYRMREGSAMHLSNVKRNIVEDVPVVYFHLIDWMKVVGQKPEPWINYWFMKMIQNLLVNASQYTALDKRNFQKTIRDMLHASKACGLTFVANRKMRLAAWNVSAYFALNKLYMKIKAVKNKI